MTRHRSCPQPGRDPVASTDTDPADQQCRSAQPRAEATGDGIRREPDPVEHLPTRTVLEELLGDAELVQWGGEAGVAQGELDLRADAADDDVVLDDRDPPGRTAPGRRGRR